MKRLRQNGEVAMHCAVLGRAFAAALAVALSGPVLAQSKNLAPGFTSLPKGARIVIMPTDIELFSISGGGVLEPKADWTEAASRHFKSALIEKKAKLGLSTIELTAKQADEADEVNALHGAVARAIAMHHFGPLSLPTKDGKLDWSIGEPTQLIKKMTGADYALFSWVRDSYASDERKAAMVAIAVLSLGRAVATGGMQTGYASLVDLNTGRVMWFNRLARQSGDLREADKAAETVDSLLDKFPVTQ
jgi:HAMP domain-containing protein